MLPPFKAPAAKNVSTRTVVLVVDGFLGFLLLMMLIGSFAP